MEQRRSCLITTRERVPDNAIPSCYKHAGGLPQDIFMGESSLLPPLPDTSTSLISAGLHQDPCAC